MAISAHEAALPVSPLAILATLIPHFVAALMSTPSCKDVWHYQFGWHISNIKAKEYQMTCPWGLAQVKKGWDGFMGVSKFKSQWGPKKEKKKKEEEINLPIKNIYIYIKWHSSENIKTQ